MWDELLWEEWKKHVPRPGIPWDDLIEETAPNAPALYHIVYIDRRLRCALELDCVRHGTLFKEVSCAKRCYYRRMEGVVGASKGRETYYVYAEWAVSGAVHGRPILEIELRTKGVQL
jgi:hypothetical protein